MELVTRGGGAPAWQPPKRPPRVAGGQVWAQQDPLPCKPDSPQHTEAASYFFSWTCRYTTTTCRPLGMLSTLRAATVRRLQSARPSRPLTCAIASLSRARAAPALSTSCGGATCAALWPLPLCARRRPYACSPWTDLQAPRHASWFWYTSASESVPLVCKWAVAGVWSVTGVNALWQIVLGCFVLWVCTGSG